MSGRDPSPAASFNEPPTFVSGAFWAMRAGGADAEGHRPPTADLFARLRARRVVAVRLAVAAAVLVAGALLLPVIAPLGLVAMLVATWSAAVDAILLARLHRSIAEAWVDLARPPE